MTIFCLFRQRSSHRASPLRPLSSCNLQRPFTSVAHLQVSIGRLLICRPVAAQECNNRILIGHELICRQLLHLYVYVYVYI